MEAYHIERLGSVDGIMLRSSEDPARAAEGPDAGAREFTEVPRSRWSSKAAVAGRLSLASCPFLTARVRSPPSATG